MFFERRAMAKTIRIKSELKQEKRKAFLSMLFFLLLAVLSFIMSMYLFVLCFSDSSKMPLGVPVGVFALSTVFFVIYKLKHKDYMVLLSGVSGENEVLNILKSLPGDFTVIMNPIINNRGKYNELDFAVIGKDAVFTVEVKNYKGALYGKSSSRELTQVKYGKGGKIYEKTVKNPMLQADFQGKRMRDLLYDLKIPFSVFPVLYFANESIELQIENDKIYDCKIIKCENELLEYIKKTHGKKITNFSDTKKLINSLKR